MNYLQYTNYPQSNHENQVSSHFLIWCENINEETQYTKRSFSFFLPHVLGNQTKRRKLAQETCSKPTLTDQETLLGSAKQTQLKTNLKDSNFSHFLLHFLSNQTEKEEKFTVGKVLLV